MRFAHLSDSHLGYRQFGILEREQDFYDVFARNIDKIIEMDVDFVIHSGDLFDNNRPSTEALLAFQKALLRLKEAKIPIYAIAGNHDSILRKDALPPQVLFKDIGLNLISHNNPAYNEGAVPSSQGRVLKERYDQLSKLADKYLKAILVSHQGIDKWMHEDTYEIELSQMPENFDYYAMGHVHNYVEEDFGKGKLVYPGSMEIWRTTESNNNYREFGKGFVVVDLSYDTPQVERIKMELPRKFYKEIIDYNKFDERIHELKEEILSLDNKPMIDLSVVGGDFESADVYEVIKKTIGENVIDLDKTLDPRSLLHLKVNEKYGREEVNRLSVDLLDNLSVGRIDDAQMISDRFYKDYYFNDEEMNGKDLGNSESDSLDDYLDRNMDNSKDATVEEKSNSKQMSFDDF